MTAESETIGYNTTAKAYPNWKSYVMSSRGMTGNYMRQPGTLQRARLYSATSGARANYDPNPNSLNVYPGTEVVTTLFKEFQFNPPDLMMSIQMAPTDGADTINPGAAAQGGSTIGMASTAVDLLFDRRQETHSGQMQGSRFDEYGRLGVAKDIMDVYAVVKGDKELLEAGTDKKSLSELTKEMTDLVARGSEILMGYRVALQYSRDFILYGIVTEMNFRFVMFNHKLVPTMGYVELKIDIHNAGNSALIRNQMAPPAVPTTTRGAVTSAVNDARQVVSGWL